MKKLAQKWMLLLTGAMGLFVLLFFFLSLHPSIARRAELSKKVASAYQGLKRFSEIHSHGEVEALKKTMGKLFKNYKKSLKFYLDYDEVLEGWFEGFSPEMGVGRFLARYSDERRLLEKALQEKGVGFIGSGGRNAFEWEEEVKSPEEMKEVQKRFWLRKRIAQILLREDIEVVNLEKLVIKTDPKEGFILPDDFGRTIPFELTLFLDFKNIPKFITAVLDRHLTPKMLVTMTECQIQVVEPQPKEVTIKKGEKVKIEEKPVKLRLLCHVFDFKEETLRKKRP